MILQTEQQKRQRQSNQTPSTPHQFHARFRGHQWIVSWRSTFERLHKENLPTLQDFDSSTADTKLDRWCTNRSTSFWTPPITKRSSSLDWLRNWSYVFIISASKTHTTILASWVPSGRSYSTKCVWQSPRVTKVACHSTWRWDSLSKEDLVWSWRLTSVTSS